MGRVKLLDKHTAELIAAGEVVERPASIIKELVENSIDAGSKKITVEIKNGGVSMLKITDDGCGIAAEDVPTAFLRHATSKIQTGEDLAAIATLGFRGEALASIAAVCKVEILTKTKEEQVGLCYQIKGGEEIASVETACATGTTIIVRDIFYNTPARMKFLKKDVAEGNACATVIDRVALSHPEIAFTFIRDGREVLRTPGDGQLLSAIRAVYGRDFAMSLIPVEYNYSNVKVTGYVTKPVCARPNQSMQIFFINGRYVKSRTMQAAVEEACKGAVMIGKHPACVLNLTILCSAVDVNVHPSKLEVRFTNEKPVFDGVYWGVKTALAEKDERKEIRIPERKAVPVSPVYVDPKVKTEQVSVFERKEKPVIVPAKQETEVDVHFTADERIKKEVPVDVPRPRPSVVVCNDNDIVPSMPRSVKTGNHVVLDIFPPVEEKKTEVQASKVKEPEKQVEDSFALPDYKIIGEAFETYIILQTGKQLVLIDKHAAHERLIFKRLMENRGEPDSQLLFTPVTVTLEKVQYGMVLENKDILTKAGFDVEDFGMGTVIVRAVPSSLVDTDIAGTIMEIAGNLGNKADAALTAKAERMYQTIACKAAIKAGDKTDPRELAELVLTLIANPDVRYCPHGRPIWITLKKSEIESNFGRA